MIEEKKIRSDKAKNISKVLKEVIKDPLQSQRDIAQNTGLSLGAVNSSLKEVEQIGTKSEIILDICKLDINLVKKGLLELDRRFSDNDELKQIRATEISQIIKDNSARYTLFRGDATDENGGTKEANVIDKLNSLLG